MGFNTDEKDLLLKIEKHLRPKYFRVTLTQSTTTGTVKGGFNKVSFYCSGNAAGTITVDGDTMDVDPGETLVISSDNGDTSFFDVEFDATGTTFKIMEYRA